MIQQVWKLQEIKCKKTVLYIYFVLEHDEAQSFDLWQEHEYMVQQSTSRRGRFRSDDIGFPNELNLYLKLSVARLSDNPLTIWKDMTSVYPILSNIAIKYLSTVATSVPSERLFSKAGLTLYN